MSRKKLITAAIILALILLIGGLIAVFTDQETKKNEFTLGNVNITLTEPNWANVNKVNNAVVIQPNQTVDKDPTVTNDGVGNAYVFVKVDVPCANVKKEGDQAASVQPLYTYTVNQGWAEITTTDTDDGSTSGTQTKVYVYGTTSAATAVAPEVTTPSVFDTVTFINADDDSVTTLEGTDLDIDVNAYGIQTDGNENTAPATIYNTNFAS